MPKAYLLANFGGPRSTNEIGIFLKSLLTDSLVTGPFFCKSLHKKLFSAIALRRAPQLVGPYNTIGGASPIYRDTEQLAKQLASYLQAPVVTFHRYLPTTHAHTVNQLYTLAPHYDLEALPLFPHFTYSVTGSIARFFHDQVPTVPIAWVPRFGSHPLFIANMVQHLQTFLSSQNISKQDCCFLFSAHSLPKKMIRAGDPYQQECEQSYQAILKAFCPDESYLCYQSKFGFGRWLNPSIKRLVTTLDTHKRYVCIVPFGFTSDHIETLYEIEHLYLPILKARGFTALRVPAIYSSPQWIETLSKILLTSNKVYTQELLL